MSAFVFAIFFGLAAATTTNIVRALAPTLWLLRKPFSCDLCMSWWSSLVLVICFALDISYQLPLLLASTAVSMLTLKILNKLSDIKLE